MRLFALYVVEILLHACTYYAPKTTTSLCFPSRSFFLTVSFSSALVPSAPASTTAFCTSSGQLSNSRVLDHPQYNMAVQHTLEAAKVLRNLGLQAPAPIRLP